jgi:D-glycero-D-manno-heptose 1,7-bisphosphate phosphatase
MSRALFLDRDGVVDELVYYASHDEWESPRRVGDLKMIDGIAEPLRRFHAAGWLLFFVTNQPSAAKGKASREELQEVHDAVVSAVGVVIARSYICFHRSENACECRKPKPYFLHEAAREFDVDLSRSWMVGDQDSDLKCGRAAGCKVALIEHRGSEHKRGGVEPDLRVADLNALADVLLATSG